MAVQTGREEAYAIQAHLEGTKQVNEQILQTRSVAELTQLVHELSQSGKIKSTELVDSLKKDFLTLSALEMGLREFGADFSNLNDSNVEHFAQLMATGVGALRNVEISQHVRELINSQKNVKRFF